MRITINRSRHMHLICSSDKDRQILHGVYIDPNKGEPVAVACDGKRLVTCPVEVDGEFPEHSVIIHKDIWKAACSTKYGPKGLEQAVIEVDDKTAMLQLKDDSQMRTPLVTGPFPNWRQVVPTEPPRLKFAVNPVFWQECRLAMGLQDDGEVAPIGITDHLSAMTVEHDECKAVIMPMRIDGDPTPGLIDFVKEHLEIQQQEEIHVWLTEQINERKERERIEELEAACIA